MGRYHYEWSFETFSRLRSVQTAGLFPDIRLKFPPYREKTTRLLRRVAGWLSGAGSGV